MNIPALDLVDQKLRTLPHYDRFASCSIALRTLIAAAVLSVITAILLGLVYLLFNPIVAYGSLASILAGLATGLGALPALLFKDVKQKTLYIMLGGAAGVMLAATAFSLVAPGIQYGNQLWPGKGIYVVGVGMMIGAFFLEFTDRWLPHGNVADNTEGMELSAALRKIWLFVIAITVHNFPEGMAVGVSFGSGDWHNGTSLAIAIALQNVPEGLAVALPLVGLGYNRIQAVLVATLTGLVEPIGGFLGVAAVTMFQPLLPIGMAFAAGAMLFVIADDIIPETQSKGKARSATFAVMTGFIVMMMLDNMLT
ncbi:MAG: ZIP family metal transporter [Methylococcaceae bacterium]|nr:ZIP family metal transporter [Methylococcaceae bacterium]